ncbi:MAG: TetR/AcrR family transcriptional regulator [Clostridia bacterium]|nr:TetR/AcrR family transcriptional regulator [Clostridia bacterium]
MAKDTKQRILEASLEIFARDGYGGTNLKDIADSVGLVKSGIYKHFSGKEEIWNEAIDMMERYYQANMKARSTSMKIPQSTDELRQMTMGMINFTLHDEKVILTRRILTQEQFRSEKIRELANRHFVYDLAGLFAGVFSAMMEQGTIKRCDAHTLALAYTAPVSVLIRLCDRSPEKEKEAAETIRRFVEMFIDQYGVKENRP